MPVIDGAYRRLTRAMGVILIALLGAYLMVSPACDRMRDEEMRRHEADQFSQP